MFATLVSTSLVFLIAASGALADFTIDTPQLTQCAPAHITWTASDGPYNLAVVPADDPCSSILIDLGDHDGLSMTWPNVTLAKGTQVVLSLLDKNDAEAWSGTMTVGDGDSGCLSDSSSASSAASDLPTTTLIATGSVPSGTGAASAASSSPVGPVGAANAGILGNSSGALSSVQLSSGATLFASLVAAAVALAL